MRQYRDFIFFERAEPPRYMRESAFDFARSEDKDSISRTEDRAVARSLSGQGRRVRGKTEASKRSRRTSSRSRREIRQVEKDRLAAEPSHLEALRKFAERAYRRPLSRAERDDLVAFYRLAAQEGRALSRRRDARHGRERAPFASLRLSRRPGRAGRGRAAALSYELASRLSYFLWSSMPDRRAPPHAAAGDLTSLPCCSRKPSECSATPGSAGSPPSSPATGWGSAASKNTTPSTASDFQASRTSCARRCTKSRFASSSTSSAAIARCSTCCTATYTS